MAAFEAVVAEVEGPLLRYAGRLVRDGDTAQDVVQDVLIRFFRAWREDIRPCPQVTCWLYRATHNRAVDHLRRESRQHALHARHAEESAGSVPPNRGAAFLVSDEAAQAVAALDALTVRERELVILKVYEEKSYREISEITGLTVTHVGVALHHAMRKLAAELRRSTTPADPAPGAARRGAQSGEPGAAGG